VNEVLSIAILGQGGSYPPEPWPHKVDEIHHNVSGATRVRDWILLLKTEEGRVPAGIGDLDLVEMTSEFAFVQQARPADVVSRKVTADDVQAQSSLAVAS
jgi:hypothetical protein